MIRSHEGFTVASAQGDYRVEQFETIAALVSAVTEIPSAFVVVDERLRSLYAAELAPLAALPTHAVSASEAEKTLGGVERTLLALQSAGAHKGTTVVAIGGGIVQDIATLAAHLWYRGIAYVYVPTTLLSMADSCIGAKSAVNLGAFKNQIGTFQSPARVLVCDRFVDTLSDEDVASGWGEIVKLAIIDSAPAFERTAADVRRDGFRGASLARNIRAALETKRRVIEIDEYERDLRRTLNYGHTFGHALESVTGNSVPHGLAVAWGCDVANYVASRIGFFRREDYWRVHAFIGEAFAYQPSRDYDADAIAAAMSRDKKAAAGTVALILPAALGDVRVVPTALNGALTSLIAEYIATDDVFAVAG